jgi:hypothetical protein
MDLSADIVMGIYLRHTGLDISGNLQTYNIIWFSDGSGGASNNGEQMLKPYEATATRIHNVGSGGLDVTYLNNFEAETAEVASGGDDGTAVLEVLAFCDDVAG